MTRLAEWCRRLLSLFQRDRLTRELDEELQLHVELRARANRALGMTAAEADLAARRSFGNRAVLRETSQETWGWFPLDRILQDFRYGGRQLLRHRSWTAAAVLTLSLGIGANAAMFGVLNALLLRTPPGVEPDGLSWLVLTTDTSARPRSLPYPAFQGLRERRDLFSGVTAFHDVHLALGDGTPERVRGAVVAGNFFDVLGVRTTLGRGFRPDEDAFPDARPVAVLSHRLWTRRYGGDPGILSRTITINGQPFAVVGVAAPQFAGLELNDPLPSVWIPMAMVAKIVPDFEPSWLTDGESSWLRTIARLSGDVSMARADAALGGFTWQAGPARSNSRSRVRIAAVAGSLFPDDRQEIGTVLGLLMIVPMLVLLVAAANAANILLARGIDRRKELAVRRALGASRGRLIRQLLIECLMLTLVAGGAGVILARALTALIGWAAEVPDALLESFAVDATVVVVTLIVSVLTAGLYGIAPAFVASNPALAPALKEEGVTFTIGQRRRRLRDALVVGQVTVSVVLLVVAGLFVSSLTKALHVDPGFEVRNGATVSFDLALQGYAPATRDTFMRNVLERARASATIESAALTTGLPLGGRMYGTEVMRPGAESDDDRVMAFIASISPAYFETLRIGLLRGRDFTASDTRSAPGVVIVNDALVRRLWPSENPIGQRLRILGVTDVVCEVVGVVQTTRYDELSESPKRYIYLPLEQSSPGQLALVARWRPGAHAGTPTLEGVVRSLDPQLPLVDVRTLEQLIGGSLDTQRAAGVLLAVLGGLALLLATLGIYGVMSHATMLRAKEIAIRTALGARPPDVWRLFVGEALKLCVIGAAIGAALAVAVARLISSFLFGLSPVDVLTFLAPALVICATGSAATWLAARKGTGLFSTAFHR